MTETPDSAQIHCSHPFWGQKMRHIFSVAKTLLSLRRTARLFVALSGAISGAVSVAIFGDCDRNCHLKLFRDISVAIFGVAVAFVR